MQETVICSTAVEASIKHRLSDYWGSESLAVYLAVWSDTSVKIPLDPALWLSLFSNPH